MPNPTATWFQRSKPVSATTAPVIISQKPFAAILVALALTVIAIGAARLSGFESPPARLSKIPDASRLLQFEDAPQGTVVVRDAKTGEQITSFGRGEGSFVRATLRALVNNRRHKGIPLEGDFRLERHDGIQLFLIDEATGKTISLNAYGPANTAAFAAFMSTQKEGEGQ
jgi:putative photosynthetic complex assembly protein